MGQKGAGGDGVKWVGRGWRRGAEERGGINGSTGSHGTNGGTEGIMC